MSGALLLLAPTWPLLLALAALWPGPRKHLLGLLWAAPLPALAAAVLLPEGAGLVLDTRLRLGLALDAPGALLGSAALLWSAAGAYAHAYLRGQPHAERFAVCWLLALSGSLGTFVAMDVLGFYIAFALASLPAYFLVVHDGSEKAQRAGGIYLALAILGEVLLLLGFVMVALAAPGETLSIADCVAALAAYPSRDAAILLLLLGFGLKAGLVPLHVWLPVAHPAAPMPASAVLSGAIIKAGIIGLVRFLPFDLGLEGWGQAIAVLGLVTAFYAVAVGITQDNPKTVLAYSSVSQMGLVVTTLGCGLAAGLPEAGLAAAFAAAHHVLAKGAVFLGVGVAQATGRRRLTLPVLVPATLLALAFGGAPFTGGALAKLAAKPFLGEGSIALAASLAGATSTLLMLHFVRCLSRQAAPDPHSRAPSGLSVPFLLMAAAALVLPWFFLPAGLGLTPADALAPKTLVGSLWPVLLGLAAALLLPAIKPRLPRLAEGDLLLFGERAFRLLPLCGAGMARLETAICRWPVGGAALLALALLLAGLLRFP